jgi:chloramphenicol 3-O phosphotransferase
MPNDRRGSAAWPNIIFVNGSSSAGKSTLCKQLQDAIEHPYLVVGFDDFVFMAPPRYFRGADTARQESLDSFTHDGVEMMLASRPGEPVRVVARFGPVFRSLIDSMAPAVRALVDAGNAVIFDHVLHDERMAESCRKSFAGLDIFSVGVTCPLPILEARERERGDRVLGRARGLADVVHTFWTYDIEVDTGSTPRQLCAEAVLSALAPTSPST